MQLHMYPQITQMSQIIGCDDTPFRLCPSLGAARRVRRVRLHAVSEHIRTPGLQMHPALAGT